MSLDFLFLISKIKTLVSEHFPNTLVSITCDDNYGDIIVSLDNKEEYYSSEFQELVSYININILWPANITNVIFVADEKISYEQIISTKHIVKAQIVAQQWETHKADQYYLDLPCESFCDNDTYPRAA